MAGGVRLQISVNHLTDITGISCLVDYMGYLHFAGHLTDITGISCLLDYMGYLHFAGKSSAKTRQNNSSNSRQILLINLHHKTYYETKH